MTRIELITADFNCGYQRKSPTSSVLYYCGDVSGSDQIFADCYLELTSSYRNSNLRSVLPRADTRSAHH